MLAVPAVLTVIFNGVSSVFQHLAAKRTTMFVGDAPIAAIAVLVMLPA